MSSLLKLKNIVYRIALEGAELQSNNVVVNSIRRVFEREASAGFGIINNFAHSNRQASRNVPNSKTNVILIKPVGDHCNLRCSYCYETLRLNGSKEKTMSIEDIRTYLHNFLGENSDVSDIFLHGGEPMLAGKEFFKEFIEIIKEMGLYGKLVLGIQTNATLLDQEWVDFFKEHKFCIGISLDGDKEIHDKYRVDHKGRGSYDSVLKGIRLLQENGLEFGIISVVSTDIAALPDCARRILNHHISIGVKYVDIHPAFTPNDTSGTSAECNMSREQFSSFMTDLAYAWAQSSNPELRLRCMEDILQNLSENKSLSCYSAGLCTHILGIDPSGAVSPCTRPFHKKYIFGNAGKMTIGELENQESYKNFVAHEAEGQNLTHNCEWSELCGFGNCPHERFENGIQDPSGKHIFCSCHDGQMDIGFPGFYSNLYQVLKEYYHWLSEVKTSRI
jgi:uncharacterized protein